MESFKERLNNLEERARALEINLCKSHETDKEIHVNSIDKEQGVIPLNEFDTFRFARAEEWLMPEFTKFDGNWKHGVVSNTNIYFLINPTQEVKDIVELSLGNKINFENHIICFKYSGESKSFESMITDKLIKDFYIFWYQGGACYGKVSIIQSLYFLLNSKPFEIENIPKQKASKNIPYDLVLYSFINKLMYSARLTIDFKNNYSFLPHLSFFLTALDIKSIEVTLKNLTPQQAIFELRYGKEIIPTTTQFHWMATGAINVDEQEETL
jgi:hypothetical protein